MSDALSDEPDLVFDPLGRPEPSRPNCAARLVATLMAQGRRLFAFVPVLVACGACLYFALSFEPALIWPIVVAGVALTGAIVGWSRAGLRFGCVALLCLALGFLNACFVARTCAPMPSLPQRAVMLHGVVAAILPDPAQDDGAALGRIRLDGAVFETGVDIGMAPLKRALVVRLKEGDPAVLQPGAIVRMRALLRPPGPPDWPGGRDPQREAWFSGLAGTGHALSPVQIIGAVPRAPWLETLREHVSQRIAASLPGQRGAVVQTLLAGEEGGISMQTRADFAGSGLAHLLAVAGLHLGLVMGVVLVVLRAGLALSERASLSWPCREIAGCGAFVGGAAYVVLTGAHLPALRSLGMAAIVTLALLTGRRAISMRALALVALVLLVTAPQDVLDVSFQMSFAAVMALIAGYEAVRPWLTRLRGEGQVWRGIVVHVVSLGLTSLFAGLATLPVSLAHFGSLQPWFVLANLLAVPLAAFWVMPWGLLALLAMPLGLEHLPLHLMGYGVALIMALAHGVAELPLAQSPVPAMPPSALFGFMIGLCWLCLWRGRARVLGCLPIALALLAPFWGGRPVVLVSPSAGLIGVESGASLLVGGAGGLDFTARAAWSQALARPVSPLPDECRHAACRVVAGPFMVLVQPWEKAQAGVTPADCEGIAAYVSAGPVQGGCPGVLTIDRFSVWRDGAIGLWPDGRRVVLRSDRALRGVRPWVLPSGGRGVPNLPMARSE